MVQTGSKVVIGCQDDEQSMPYLLVSEDDWLEYPTSEWIATVKSKQSESQQCAQLLRWRRIELNSLFLTELDSACIDSMEAPPIATIVSAGSRLLVALTPVAGSKHTSFFII